MKKSTLYLAITKNIRYTIKEIERKVDEHNLWEEWDEDNRNENQ